MSRKEFEATYRQMAVEELMELTTELEDLLPEARLELMAELRRRGKQQADIDQYAIERKGALDGDAPEGAESSHDGQPEESAGLGNDQARGRSTMPAGPMPADWARIPGFSMNESMAVAAYLEQCGIPFQIVRAASSGRAPFLVAVPREQFKDCIAALKQFYELFDERPEPFTGECPGCGVHLEGVETCSACGLVLCPDEWAARSGHPFVEFLKQNGLGRPPNGTVLRSMGM